jgi:hypothetical protein
MQRQWKQSKREREETENKIIERQRGSEENGSGREKQRCYRKEREHGSKKGAETDAKRNGKNRTGTTRNEDGGEIQRGVERNREGNREGH